MTVPEFIHEMAVWGASYLGEVRKVAPEPTTERQHRIKTLALQILVDPVNLSLHGDDQQRFLLKSEAADFALLRIRAAMLALINKGEDSTDLLLDAARWYSGHAPHIKARANKGKIPVPCGLVQTIDGAVRLHLFADGPMDIPLGPQQSKRLLIGVPVTSLVFEKPKGRTWRMHISQATPKRKLRT